MSSKDQILRAIRRQNVSAVELPSLDRAWTTYPDPSAQFAQVLEAVGGRCVPALDLAEVERHVRAAPAFVEARTVVSTASNLEIGNLDLDSLDDAHDAEHIDYMIAAGEFAVAENAAVWITDRGLRHRAALFLAQHLALVVDARDLVDNLHAAYERLRFDDRGYGVFISGPSKTADIEQSLVIGAHGPRSLTVYLVGSPP